MYKRLIYKELQKRLEEPRRFIQTLLGPRQVGKTTLTLQVLESLKTPFHFISADTATLEDLYWIASGWDQGRRLAQENKRALLVIDEIQKIPEWEKMVKKLWDEDTRKKIPLKVVLLGSSPWLMQKGLSESLAGRFEILPVTHWTYGEMKEAFNWDLDAYTYFGGYPGAAPFADKKDPSRWAHYINDSLIETTLSRDIFLMTQINKPALLRRLFQLGCRYSGQILSYQKMLGQLHDTGNTTTLAHYLELLSGAGILTGIHKYSPKEIQARSSSPKLQVLNTALMSAQSGKSFLEAKGDPVFWGRLTESMVGAYLINAVRGTSIELFYWRERNQEVDFVLKKGSSLIAIEVKSSLRKETLSGMDAFIKAHRPKHSLLVGNDGIPIEEFIKAPITHWFS
jgi:predicted AAA+ superfamily ATPase